MQLATLALTHHWSGFLSVGIFALAYIFVMLEEITTLRKSKPVLFAAGLLWAILGYAAHLQGKSDLVHNAMNANFLEYAQLFFFLLVAMLYVSVMQEREVFNALRNWLISRQYSYRQLFWITGFLAFFLSPIVDNLTTALILCAVILSVGKGYERFISLSCINIVVAANAGGVFTPFGDITSLMVWQQDQLSFTEFFHLFFPALVNYIIPAFFLQLPLTAGLTPTVQQAVPLKSGAYQVIGLFALTLVTTILFHHVLHLPAVCGMMLGLGYLKLFSFSLKRKESFDIFIHFRNIEWDTLLFFYGVMLCVGALATIGYLHLLGESLFAIPSIFGIASATLANTIIGIVSAVIDNIPVMYAVLQMDLPLSTGQWLLVTLTTGVGGSLLSIGSAAGVALMGQAHGIYTFSEHFKWIWAIALGYIASIAFHCWWNQALFLTS